MSADLLGRLIDEHSAALVLLARSLCDCPEDVVQEAFIQLAQQHPWPDQPTAWLYRVVRNGAHTASRAARRRSKHEEAARHRKESWFEPNVENTVDAGIAEAALERLPKEQAEVVILRIWSQMTFKEIGKLTQASSSTAQRRYVEAIDALRDHLEIPCPKNTTPPSTTAN